MSTARRSVIVALLLAVVLAGVVLLVWFRPSPSRVPPPVTTSPGGRERDTLLAGDTARPNHWDPAAGRGVLISAGLPPDSGFVIRPGFVDGGFDGWGASDVRPLSQTRWDLFGRSGAFGTARLTPQMALPADDACLVWPEGGLAPAHAGWRAALETGRATAVALDSVEAMSRADSSRLVIEVTRLAASTKGESDSLFGSVPFVVRSVYRFRTGDLDGIAASVQRSIHSEANPREEHLFLIAERPVGSTESYRLGYIIRAAGAEGALAVTDPLAAVSLSETRRLVLIVSHESEEGSAVWWLERVAPRQWRVRWRSATVGC